MPPSETTVELPAVAEPELAPPPTAVARFEIRYSRFLDPKGNAVRPLPDFAHDRAELVALYRAMVLARRFDAKAVALQRTGRLGTFASALGQEAVPVGVALAFKLRREKRAAVCVFGDGATSKGDVAEALNVAGAWQLPAVFVINNNRWAISLPLAQQTTAETLAQKAIAAGIEGEQVDGNDVIAVREAVSRALAKARSGGGPHLIEALTYRLGDHTTADDASRYRNGSEVSARWAEEPIARLRNYLVAAGMWGKADEEQLLAEITLTIERAAEAYLATPPQDPEAMFDFTYETLPKELAEQRQATLGLVRK